MTGYRPSAGLALFAVALSLAVCVSAGPSWGPISRTISGPARGGYVADGASAQYSLTLTTDVDIPFNSTFNLTITAAGGSPNYTTPVCSTSNGTAFPSEGSTLLTSTPALNATDNVTCTFNVSVGSTDVNYGKIPMFFVNAYFINGTNTSLTIAVPQANTTEVVVHSGITLSAVSTFLDSSETKFYSDSAGSQTGNKLPQLGAKVAYSFIITNGATMVANGTAFSLTVSGADAGSTICVSGGQNVTTALPANLNSGQNITCTFTVTVSMSHQIQGQIGPMNVTVQLGAAPQLSMAPILTPVVPVHSGSTLSLTYDNTPSNYIDVSALNKKLPKVNATVTYTLTLINGKKSVPANSMLNFTMSPSNFKNLTIKNCNINVENTTVLAPNGDITCKLELVVDAAEADAAIIPAINVIARWTKGVTGVNFIPEAAAPETAVAPSQPKLYVLTAVTDSARQGKVGSDYLAKELGEVTYTVVLINGNSAIASADNLTLAVTTTDSAYPKSACASLNPTVDANAALVCSFKVYVNRDHIAAQELPSISVKAATATNATYAGPVTVDSVRLYTYVYIAANAPVVSTNSTTYMTVNGRQVAKTNAKVRYNFTLTNGANPVPANTIINITYTYTGASQANTYCSDGSFKLGQVRSSAFAAYARVSCYVNIVALSAGIPEFTATVTTTPSLDSVPSTAVGYFMPMSVASTSPIILTSSSILSGNYTNITYNYGIVNPVAGEGAVVQYTLVLINGQNNVTKGSNLQLTTTRPGNTNLTACVAGAGSTVFNSTSTDLQAYESLVCTFNVTVNSQDVALGQLPAFNVTAWSNNSVYAGPTAMKAVGLDAQRALSVQHSWTSTLYKIVNGTRRYQATAQIDYTIMFTNGAEPIPSTTLIGLQLSATAPVGTFGFCNAATDASTTNPRNGLAEFDTYKCTLRYIVADKDITAGALPAFNVTATVTPVRGVPYSTTAQVNAIPLFTNTPCTRCRECLSVMTTFITANSLLSQTDIERIASLFQPECNKRYPTTACNDTATYIKQSSTGNLAKRAGLLCKALGQCVPDEMEEGCSLATTNVVPAGNLDVCTVSGTTGGSKEIPGMVNNMTILSAGRCFDNSYCGNTQVCKEDTVAGYQCVCNNATSQGETCSAYYTCVDSPCTNCKNCLSNAKAFARDFKDTKAAATVEAAFKDRCINTWKLPSADCSKAALLIGTSYNGNLGKRPGWICSALARCPSVENIANELPGCILVPNVTVNGSVTYAANFSVCSNDGSVTGAVVPGTFEQGAYPNNTCMADAGCNTTLEEKCSKAAGTQFCYCSATSGQDVCEDLGVCKAPASCTSCSTCLEAARSFVQTQLAVTNAETMASAWSTFCKGSNMNAGSDCDPVSEVIKQNINVGKRAGTLCNMIYKCPTEGICKYNASVTLYGNTTVTLLEEKLLDECTVEGIQGSNAVPGVVNELRLPYGTCSLGNTTCPVDHFCDLTTDGGKLCKCLSATEALTSTVPAGGDTCMKYSPCKRTPCKVCSDCLADMTAFTKAQLYTQTRPELSAAFSKYCTDKNYTAASCQTVATKIAALSTNIAFGKRAGALCKELTLCDEATLTSQGACTLKASATLTGSLDLCAVEGVTAGTDVLGTTRVQTLPSKRCDKDLDCNADGGDNYVCDISLSAQFCTCHKGEDTCRTLGTCRKRPCTACQDCLKGFQDYDGSPANFSAACMSVVNSTDRCNVASSALSTTYQSNGYKRAASICMVLGECVPAGMNGCNLTVGGLKAPLHQCTQQGVSTGSALTDFPIDKYVYNNASGECIKDADCTTSGEFCSFDKTAATTSVTCMCKSATGADTCVPLGICRQRPCTKCQACLDYLNPKIKTELNKTTPDKSAPCADAYTGCTAAKTKYVTGVTPGLFGFRAGALCSVMQYCTDLPSDCSLRAMVGGRNVTGAFDMCTAEGIVGGSPVSVAPIGACLKDADCATDQQCDRNTMWSPPVYSCSVGQDTDMKYGTCKPKPTASNVTVPPCTRCNTCLKVLRNSAETAALNTTLTATQLSSRFYTACSAGNYSLTACYAVKTLIEGSYKGNLARRAGALCIRLGECSTSLSGDATCTLSTTPTAAVTPETLLSTSGGVNVTAGSNATTSGSNITAGGNTTAGSNSTSAGNATNASNSTGSSSTTTVAAGPTVSGQLDACTIEGIKGGMNVAGTYGFGVAPNNTCVLDSDCATGKFCSSDATLTVCRCFGGMDTCDVLATCQPIPAAPAPAPELSNCEKCQGCLEKVQSFATGAVGNTNTAALAATFQSLCAANISTDLLVCKPVSDAILKSRQGILARRAGALCSRLGLCADELLTSTSCKLTGVSQGLSPVGKLDLCQEAGASTPAVFTPDNTTCLVDSNCVGNSTTYDGSMVCSMASPNTTCTCNKGVDTCVRTGTCISFCDAQQSFIDGVNAKVNLLKCGGPYDTSCGDGKECKPSSQCQVLACSSAKGIYKEACYGFCTSMERKVLSAVMSDDGTSINLKLNTPAATANFACASLFDPASSKLGSDAWCSVDDTNLKISLGRSATITPNLDSLTIASSQAVLYDRLAAGTSKFAAGTVPVAGCSACTPPAPVVMGPKIVSEPCNVASAADVIIDASFSKDVSGRPFTAVYWEQVKSGGVAGDAVLAAAMEKANAAGDLRVIIPASQIASLKNGAYALKVTVTNFLGARDSAQHTFTKADSGAAPVITPLVTGVVPFNIADGVKVAVQLVAASVCSGKEVVYEWTSVDTPAWNAVPANYNRKDLIIPGPVPGVTSGQERVVSLTAKFKDSELATTVNVTLRAEGSPLVAKLKGPSGDIKSDAVITLSAAGSFDPDDPEGANPLAVEWECIRADYPAPCFTGMEQGEKKGLTWVLNAALLATDIEHTFKVTIASGSRSDSAQLKLRATAQAIATGRIRRICGVGACPQRHSADDPLSLTIALDAGSEGAQIAWSADHDVALTGTGYDFTIQPSNLPKSGFVTVRAALTLNNQPSATTITIPINSAPQCPANTACLKVTPASGVFPAARFTAEAVGFVDDQATGLRFDFGIRDVYGTRKVISSSPAPTFIFSGLPVGVNKLYVCAVDSDGASSCAHDVTVEILQAPADFNAADAVAAFDVNELNKAGDMSVLASGAQSFVNLAKYDEGSNTTVQQTPEQVQQMQNMIAAKTGAFINTLAKSADAYINDPQTMQQVVSAVATLSKAGAQITKDSKQKMLNVAKSGITSVKLSKKPLGTSEASRLWAVVAAGNSMKEVCKVPQVCATSAQNGRQLLQDWYGRSLLEKASAMSPVMVPMQPFVHYSRLLLVANTTDNSTTNSTVNSTATNTTTGSNATAPATAPATPQQPEAPAAPAAPAFVPAFADQASTVADMLAEATPSGVSYVSGGDNGLYVSVSNMLGRAYEFATARLVVGPALDTAGDAASSTSGINSLVKFSKRLTGVCKDEDGTPIGTSATCDQVVVPVRITYSPDATALLKPAATGRRLAAATALPAGFEPVSGAVTIEATGSSASGALPCDGCTASITIPVWEEKQPDTLYHCTQIVDGAYVLDSVVASDNGGVKLSETTPPVPTVECVVNKAGTYLVGKAADPTIPPQAPVISVDGYADFKSNVTIGQPLRVKMTFETVNGFDWDKFIADNTKVTAFKETIKGMIVSGIAQYIPAANTIAKEHITIDNLRKGSIAMDITIATSTIKDQFSLNKLAGMLIQEPAALLKGAMAEADWNAFLGQYGLTGDIKAEQIKPVAAPANNLPAIVGGVVGGVGGAILIGAVSMFIIKRRRATGIEPRNRQGLMADEDGGV